MRSTLNPELRLVGALVCLMVWVMGAHAQSPPSAFTIGVLPNVSARVILANYQPMREYFQRELKQPVDIATAADFRAFSESTMKGVYQIVVTAANVGRVNQLDGKWEPIAIYEPAIPAVLVAAAGNASNSAEQLRGKILAVGNPQSLVVLRGLQWLREQGLQEGRDFKLSRVSNDDSLGALIRSGEAPLAMMSMGEFRAIGETTRSELKIATEFARVPGFLVMAGPQLPAAERERVKALMLKFPMSDDGKKFFSLSGFTNIREVKSGELDPLDAFVPATRTGLGISK